MGILAEAQSFEKSERRTFISRGRFREKSGSRHRGE